MDDDRPHEFRSLTQEEREANPEFDAFCRTCDKNVKLAGRYLPGIELGPFYSCPNE